MTHEKYNEMKTVSYNHEAVYTCAIKKAQNYVTHIETLRWNNRRCQSRVGSELEAHWNPGESSGSLALPDAMFQKSWRHKNPQILIHTNNKNPEKGFLLFRKYIHVNLP